MNGLRQSGLHFYVGLESESVTISQYLASAITSQEITCPLQPAAKDKIRTTYLYVISKTVSDHLDSL